MMEYNNVKKIINKVIVVILKHVDKGNRYNLTLIQVYQVNGLCYSIVHIIYSFNDLIMQVQ